MKKNIFIGIVFLTLGLNSCKFESLKKDNPVYDSIDRINDYPLTKDKEDSNNTNSSEDCIISFDEFFERFSKDSSFQKHRVKFPLKELYYLDMESSEMKTDLINESDYKYYDFVQDKDAMKNEFGKYTIEVEKLNDSTVHYKQIGYDNGIRVIYKFLLITGCWFLVEIEDMSA